MRRFILVIILTLVALPAAAQRIDLDFAELAEHAEEEVEITLDASMLRLAAKFLSADDPDELAVRDMINGLSGIYVRSYQFPESTEYEYDRRIFERVKSRLGPTWKPFVNVRSRTKDNVTIMADMRGEKINGLVIIAAESHEFTVVRIEGSIDIDRLADLEGQFGIPQISQERDRD